MPKMRLRLMKLKDCPNGTRFFTIQKWLPRTLVTVNRKRDDAIYHFGHEFNMTALKRRAPSYWRVWVIVNYKDLP